AVIERLAGMQAQVPKPPFAGLWTRIAGFRRTDLIEAIDRKEVVRATLMRATIHLFSTRDYVTLRGALRPLLDDAFAFLGKRLEGIDVEKVVAWGRRTFAKPMTFEELRTR